jgi:cyclase
VEPVGEALLGRVLRLGEHVHALASEPEAASNAGIVVGEDATLLVDCRLTPALGRDLVERARELAGGRPLAYLVNTHHHGDHCFGNEACGDAVVISSKPTRVAMKLCWDDEAEMLAALRPHQAEEYRGARRRLPDVCIDSGATIELGGCEARLEVVGPAHTEGDTVVWIPVERVLYVGDLVFHGHWPMVAEADVPRWIGLLGRLAERDPAVVVPGHGPPGGVELLERMAGCLMLLARLAVDEDDAEPAIDASPFAGWLHPGRVGPAIERLRDIAGRELRAVASQSSY